MWNIYQATGEFDTVNQHTIDVQGGSKTVIDITQLVVKRIGTLVMIIDGWQPWEID